MKTNPNSTADAPRFGRRTFLKGASGAALLTLVAPKRLVAGPVKDTSPLYWVRNIPNQPFAADGDGNYHAGVDSLLGLMARRNLKFYQSSTEGDWSGRWGLIAANDVVLVKVNAQWKYRGCTNSDVIRGLVQRILDHPDGFRGEVVILDNGQGRGSLACNTRAMYNGDRSIQANANNRKHHFLYLARQVFAGKPVSAVLLDPMGGTYIADWDHSTDGYRKLGIVSYPCFTTASGRRVELREGIWTGSGFRQNLKLINVPVLKHHDRGGSEITASLKNLYGLLTMADGLSGYRHYKGLGQTCGKMVVTVRAPVLNVIDAIWVSHTSISGHPDSSPARVNQLMASQDPVALDFCAARKILFPIDRNPRHDPLYKGIKAWLQLAAQVINEQGGLHNPRHGLFVNQVTLDESRMQIHEA